jgi:hypothetical protein
VLFDQPPRLIDVRVENVTAQSTRAMRTVLAGGEAVMARSTYSDNAIAAPLSARLRPPEQTENRVFGWRRERTITR